jgi:transposase
MIPTTLRVLLCASPVDMRRSFDSLAALVVERLDEDPTRNDVLFVFVNARRDKVKLLWRDGNGVCLLYKRWDDDEAQLPTIPEGADRVVMDMAALARLLSGVPTLSKMQVEPTAKDVARAARTAARKMMEQQQNQGR